MAYGTVQTDNLVYSTSSGDVTVAVSGIAVQGAPVISGISGVFTSSVSGATVTGNTVLGSTISGITGVFTSYLSGAVITGVTVQATTYTGVTGVFTTQLSGATITGNTVQGTVVTAQTGVFTDTISGLSFTGSTGNFTTLNAVTAIVETGVVKTNITVTGDINSSGNLLVAGSGTISGLKVTALLSGETITGTTAQFNTITGNTIQATAYTGITGIFTTQLSGATITGNTIQATTYTGVTGVFTTELSGATITGVTGNFTTLNASFIPGYAVLSGAQTFSGGQRGNVNVVSYTTGIALDFSTSNNFEITLTGNTTLQNPTNVVSGQGGAVTIIQGSSGNTMAFGSNWNYPGGSGSVPSLTAVSGAKDLIAYYAINATQIAYRLISDIKA